MPIKNGNVHFTRLSNNSKYNYLQFDEDDKIHWKVKQKIAKKFKELEDEIDNLITTNFFKFDNFLTENDLESGMGSIGKIKKS